MGCACAKEREEEIGMKDKETLARIQAKISNNPCAPSVIKKLTVPLSSLYRLGDTIARNNTGSLAKAEYLCTYQPCYIRVIQKVSGRVQLQQKKKLETEIERLAILDHPFILRTYEVMQDDDNFYLAMEHFPGGTLQDFMTDERLTNEALVAKIMVPIFSVLCYCHQQGVVHGNISPLSIMFQHMEAANPRVKMSAFFDCDSMPLSSAPSIHESHFKAPERDANKSEKCDIWSCGALIYILLTGTSPSGLPLTEAVPPGTFGKNFSVNVSKLAGRTREVQNLLASMLNVNHRARLTATECRTHRWFPLHVKQSSMQPATLKRYLFSLKRSRGHNVLQSAVMRFILLRIAKEKELEVLVDPFNALDTDSDGLLNLEEMLHGYMRVLAEEDAIYTSKKVMEAADLNKSGDISYSEFLMCALGEKKLMTSENLRLVFSCVDRNNSGQAAVQDVCNFFLLKTSDLQLPGTQMTFEEFSALMNSTS